MPMFLEPKGFNLTVSKSPTEHNLFCTMCFEDWAALLAHNAAIAAPSAALLLNCLNCSLFSTDRGQPLPASFLEMALTHVLLESLSTEFEKMGGLCAGNVAPARRCAANKSEESPQNPGSGWFSRFITWSPRNESSSFYMTLIPEQIACVSFLPSNYAIIFFGTFDDR